MIHWVLAQIKKINTIPEPQKSIIFTVILFLYQVSFIPTQSTFVVLMSFALQDFWHAILLEFISGVLSCSLTYFVVSRFMKERLREKYKDSTLYKVVTVESKKHPYKVNLMLRVMFIPVTFKNVLVALSDISPFIVMVCFVPFIFFFGGLYTFIGVNLSKAEEYLYPKDFASKSFAEKLKVVMGYFIITATISLFVFLSWFTKKKLKEYDAKYQGKKDFAELKESGPGVSEDSSVDNLINE